MKRAWLYEMRQMPDFPEPLAHWRTGPVYDLEAVWEWYHRRKDGAA